MMAREITKEGIIVFSINGSFRTPRYIFLYKNNSTDKDTVDNQKISQGTFEYAGIYAIDGETLHSFKRVNN